jgi:hypothetical protein
MPPHLTVFGIEGLKKARYTDNRPAFSALEHQPRDYGGIENTTADLPNLPER